jgi:hypothetical protein
MKIIVDTKSDSREEIEALINFLNAIIKKENKKEFEVDSSAVGGFADFFGEIGNAVEEKNKPKNRNEEELDFYDGVQLY